MANNTQSYHELEFKLHAPSDDILAQAEAWVLSEKGIFAPRKSIAPPMMRGLFRRPNEITEERVRLYWDTEGLDAFHEGIEIRQETRQKGGVKQMIKISGNNDCDLPMMNRMEYPCRLDEFGVCFDEISPKPVRKMLMQKFNGKIFKPIIAMVSQRTRLKYHPEGDQDILIEAAFDYPCWGFAFNGFVWQAPEMELEIIQGSDDDAAANAILERESRRFEDKFPKFSRVATSKPTPGFERLGTFMSSEDGLKAFQRLDATREWWLSPTLKADFDLTNNVLARQAVAG